MDNLPIGTNQITKKGNILHILAYILLFFPVISYVMFTGASVIDLYTEFTFCIGEHAPSDSISYCVLLPLWFLYIGVSFLILSLIFEIISIFKKRKNGEKFGLSQTVYFVLFILMAILTYLATLIPWLS